MSNDNQIALEYYNKGVLCYQKRDLDGAMSNWIEAVRHQPDLVSAIENLGIAYRLKGNPEAALKCLNQAIHFAPDKPSIYYNRALAYVDKTDFAQAITDYTQALTLDPKYPFAHCNRGGLYLKIGETEKARADLTIALQLDPNDQLAKKLLQTVNELPDIETIVSAALQDIQEKRLEKAWLKLQVAHQYGGKTNSKVHVGFGAIYEQQDSIAKAFAAFDYAVSRDPSSPQAYNNRGRMSMLLQNWDAAANDFEQTIRLQPDNARGYFNLGGIYLQRNQPEKALTYFEGSAKLGYAPAKQAASDAKKQIGKVAPITSQQKPFNVASPEKQDFIQSVLLLTQFAYQHCGPHQWLSIVNTSSFFGLHQQQKTKTDVFWGVTIEQLIEANKDGYKGNIMGATLEFTAPPSFMIRITRPAEKDYQLSFYVKRKFEGLPDAAFVKQENHTWLLPYEMLAPKLTELVETGVIKKNEHSLVYP